jgi:hypothetical protein
MAKAKRLVLVTADSVDAMLSNPNPMYVQLAIGRALVGLLKRQTDEEQNSNATLAHNGIGFTGADAHWATVTAKYFQRNNRLQDWQIQAWTKICKNGHTRLSKYHKQLNQIAVEKQQSQQAVITY